MKIKIAFIVLMCLAGTGFSQVVYTDLEDKPAVIGHAYSFNFMGGVEEFVIENYTLHGSSIELLCLAEGAQVIVCPLDSISKSGVDLLTEGMDIGPSESFSTNKGRKNFVIYYDGVYTDWVGQCGYIGFRFKNGSDIHYGWAKIAVEVGAEAVLKLYGYAYQSQPNTAIKAGDTGKEHIQDIADIHCSIFPNPASQEVKLSVIARQIEIFDLGGRCLKSFDNTDNISLSGLANGIYQLRIHTGHGLVVKPFVKQ